MAKQKGNETPFVVPMVGAVLIAMILFQGETLIQMVENMITTKKEKFLTDKIVEAREAKNAQMKSRQKTTTKNKCCTELFEAKRGEDGANFTGALNTASRTCKSSCGYLRKLVNQCVAVGQKCNGSDVGASNSQPVFNPQQSVNQIDGANDAQEQVAELQAPTKSETLSQACQNERNACMLKIPKIFQ